MSWFRKSRKHPIPAHGFVAIELESTITVEASQLVRLLTECGLSCDEFKVLIFSFGSKRFAMKMAGIPESAQTIFVQQAVQLIADTTNDATAVKVAQELLSQMNSFEPKDANSFISFVRFGLVNVLAKTPSEPVFPGLIPIIGNLITLDVDKFKTVELVA
jgi:hypothetical protein